MRRFRRGATTSPSMRRPGAGYGRLCFGAPGPTQEVEPRGDITPEMFLTEEEIAASKENLDNIKSVNADGDTIVDLTNE